MKFDYSFVDLDYTLFDTDRFIIDMRNIFSYHGVSQKDYEETYKQSLCTKNREEFDYSFGEQVEFLRERGYRLEQGVVAELKKLLDNDYLFPDSVSFVKFLKRISTRVVLLTAGDLKFQEEKIKRCGVAGSFNEVVILHGHKDNYIRPFVEKNYKILFVNDSWRENTRLRKEFPNLLIIGVDGPHGQRDNDGAAQDLIYLPSLTDIKNYVTGLN